ncbi:MAG: hypothetical protein IT363_09815 [Methanoregulaceae archaeon]|nr:hypothetical protein [Methanoregulaceae archaeon]
MKTRLALLAFAAIVPFSAMAQFDFGGAAAQKPAWESFTLPSKKMKLDFRNANVDMVLSLFTRTSGITIVKDPGLTAPLTLTTAKEVPLKEAFEILNAALSVRNFELKKEGNLLVVRPRQQQRGGDRGGFGGMSQDQIGEMMRNMGNSSTELKVYQIQFANASQVARVVNEVFAQSGQNPLQGLMGMFAGMQQGGRGGRGGFNPGAMGGNQTVVRASSDDFSNTVIVNAPRTTHSQVENLIKQIDKQTDDPTKAKVYKLNYATAQEMQPIIQNLLVANQPLGRGGQSASQQPVDRRFSFMGFGGNNRNQTQGSAIAEARTNSIIVTTTDENQLLVEQVIKELDTEVKLESNTFVFPLENARADQVANLLRQAFGNRSGAGNAGNNQNRNTGTTNQNRNNQNRNNQNRQGGGGGFGANNIDPNATELELLLEDENLTAGELMTNVAVQGGIFGQFFGGGGGQQNQQNRQNVPLGRDAQGRLVPVQDLTNQVTVIPDQNTNSLIVVTTPENAELIRSLLGQLDRIPEQVMIETIIVEASLDSSSRLGIEWQDAHGKVFGSTGTSGTANQDFGLRPNNTLPQGFRYTLTGGALSAFMNALKTDTKFNVLSTPRIFTSNNVEAQINISQRVPFVVSQRADANGNITFNYDFEDVGIVLTVTPRITAGGYVTMDVNQTANDLQGFTSFNAPIVNQRQAQTTVAVRDGETIILGGIIRSTVSTTTKKIPLLGDIPILGNLFRSTDKSDQKTELLVFLTPRVVRDPAEAAKLTDEQRKKLSLPTQDQLNKSGVFGDKTNKSQTGGGN